MSAFQTTVGFQQGFGVIGEKAYIGPSRVKPGLLKSADPTLNIVGRAAAIKAGATGSFPVAADGGINPKTMQVGVGDAGVFAGLIVNPKAYASLGTLAGGSLAPTTTLPNDIVVELATEDDWIISLAAASNPGDVVYYTTATGVLVTAAPGAAIPGGAAGPIGTIDRFVNAAASLAVVHLEPRVPSLAP